MAVSAGTTPPQAALFSLGRVLRLPLLPGQEFSAVSGINNRGDAVGSQGNTVGVPSVIWLRRS